jgi:hypothetical protein
LAQSGPSCANIIVMLADNLGYGDGSYNRANPKPDTDANTNPERYTNAHAYGYSNSERYSNAYAYSDANSYSYSNAYAYANPDADPRSSDKPYGYRGVIYSD